LHYAGLVLHLDRFLGARSHALDLATGRSVQLISSDDSAMAVFDTRDRRTLIDLDVSGGRRLEVWERWSPAGSLLSSDVRIRDFIEMLDCAVHGAPRAFDASGGALVDQPFLRRAFAREARRRGWVPVDAEMLGRLLRTKAATHLADRSLVVFVDRTTLSARALSALLAVAARDARPHVLVQATRPGAGDSLEETATRRRRPFVVREVVERFGESGGSPAEVTAEHEARARWRVLLHDLAGAKNAGDERLELARLLSAGDQRFEAQAVIAAAAAGSPECAPQAAAIAAEIRERAADKAGQQFGESGSNGKRGWEMVDDLVDVLRMCQDIEDEQTALARVGTFLRDRLQASAVAFVVRHGRTSRVLARVGSELAGVDLALRSMETGAPIPAERRHGPVESACPVRHAAEVIGAVWCRWSAGVPVATEHAATLLGVAAAATAPSMRLALAKAEPALDRTNPVPELVGESAALMAVRDAILRAAQSPFPVVIEGESGSGKELAARAIHTRSARRDRKFCAVNCAALVDELVEAELFGHVKGAFTGATTDRQGLFEEAAGGTLFLDEVVEQCPRVQAKLLRVLQEGEIRRLGETFVRKVDVRIVAATNRPLASAVAAGGFRADLWYRLDVVRITLPPLRERLEDLPILVHHLWRALALRTGSRAALSAHAVSALARYDWPGNIRELQNVLASMLVAAPRGGLIGPALLPLHVARAAALEPCATLADARRQFEARYVRAALARAGGRTSTAARDLGISRQGLAKLMGRLGIAETPESRAVAQ
jgi:DNA-binding NtrC family response regulator